MIMSTNKCKMFLVFLSEFFNLFFLALRSWMLMIVIVFMVINSFRVLNYWKRSSSITYLEPIQPAKEATLRLRRNIIVCQGKYNRSNVCRNVLSEMRHAKWRTCYNLSQTEELEQSEVEVLIRKSRGLPVVLHRSDLRCGGKPFLLNAANVEFPLAAACDASSFMPCCHHKTGRCGLGSKYCSCQSCTDFRNEISAELYNWIPLSGCTFIKFTSQEACDMMSNRISNLILVGDSLVRHLYNALMIIFTDDFHAGSLRVDLLENQTRSCKSFMQFVDGGRTSCHLKTLTSIPHGHESKFCRGDFRFEFSFKEYYSIKHALSVLAEIRRHLNSKNTVVAIGVGLHMNLNSESIQKQIMEPILEMKNRSASIWPYILWISIHAHGSLKDAQYSSPSYNDRISAFNENMQNYLDARHIPVFDTFNLTRGVRSIDGTHFGFGINMMKGQLLLNFIHETF